MRNFQKTTLKTFSACLFPLKAPNKGLKKCNKTGQLTLVIRHSGPENGKRKPLFAFG